jgi:hypothetical protein
MTRPIIRLEWISLLYLVLFVMAVLSPSMIKDGFFGVSEEYMEEIFIFVFGLTGLAVFTIYERIMESKDRDHAHAISDLDRAKKELVSSYEYIGSVNRHIESLKKLANESVTSIGEEDRHQVELFRSIASSAATLIRAQHGMIRIVALNKLRTVREFSMDPNAFTSVPNKDLLETHNSKKTHAFIHDEEGTEVLVIPSSRMDMDVKAFLLISLPKGYVPEIDSEMLKVYANQAEVLYRILVKETEKELESTGELTNERVCV